MTEENKPLDSDLPKTSMDDLTSQEIFPEVKENAIEAVQNAQKERQEIEEKEAAAAQVAGVKLKKDGTPAKRRGRKSNAELASSGAPQREFYNPKQKAQNNNAAPLNPHAVHVESIYAAQVISGTIEQATVALISKDFALKDEERIANIQAWKNLCDSQGGVNLTPVQHVMLSHAAILLTRIGTSSETRSKMQLVKAWAKHKISGWKNALSNRGKDTKRKNDIRKEESGKPEKDGKADHSSRSVS